jgi:hypothetical protein
MKLFLDWSPLVLILLVMFAAVVLSIWLVDKLEPLEIEDEGVTPQPFKEWVMGLFARIKARWPKWLRMQLVPKMTKTRKAVWMVILAGLFTGAEAMVATGIELPFSRDISPWLRGLLIMGVTVGAFYFRWRASKESNA